MGSREKNEEMTGMIRESKRMKEDVFKEKNEERDENRME